MRDLSRAGTGGGEPCDLALARGEGDEGPCRRLEVHRDQPRWGGPVKTGEVDALSGDDMQRVFDTAIVDPANQLFELLRSRGGEPVAVRGRAMTQPPIRGDDNVQRCDGRGSRVARHHIDCAAARRIVGHGPRRTRRPGFGGDAPVSTGRGSATGGHGDGGSGEKRRRGKRGPTPLCRARRQDVWSSDRRQR